MSYRAFVFPPLFFIAGDRERTVRSTVSVARSSRLLPGVEHLLHGSIDDRNHAVVGRRLREVGRHRVDDFGDDVGMRDHDDPHVDTMLLPEPSEDRAGSFDLAHRALLARVGVEARVVGEIHGRETLGEEILKHLRLGLHGVELSRRDDVDRLVTRAADLSLDLHGEPFDHVRAAGFGAVASHGHQKFHVRAPCSGKKGSEKVCDWCIVEGKIRSTKHIFAQTIAN